MKNHKSFIWGALNLLLLFSCNTYCDNGLKSDGVQIEYFDNKVKRSETEVKNCLCSGLVKDYYPNGKLYSTGNCINGKNIGKWNFFDNNGYRKAIAEWNDGRLVRYTINLSDTVQILYEPKSNRLYNTEGKIISNSSIKEIFAHSTETTVVNNEMFGLSDYSSLIILSKDLKVLFNLKHVKDKDFWEIYKKRCINLQLNDTFLKSGFDFSIKDGFIYIKLYYRNTYHDIEPRVSSFAFSLQA